MHIACYGPAGKPGTPNGSSFVSANYLILRYLLAQGHRLTRFGFAEDAPDLAAYANYRYIPVDATGLGRLAEWGKRTWFPQHSNAGLYGLANRLWGGFRTATQEQALARTVAQHHRQTPYDLTLSLGFPAAFRLSQVLSVAWLQSPYHTEQAAIQRLRAEITRYCGAGEYWKLYGFYTLRALIAPRVAQRADLSICLSEWSRQEAIAWGMNPDRIQVLPYPIDLETFQPRPPQPTARFRLLWLGRIIPRKRLDLMMDALALLAAERQDVVLQIVGGFAYGLGYRQCLERFPYPDMVEYREGVTHGEVPSLLQACDAVVQPSESENYGSAIAEGLACGRPVIAGPTNGTLDYAGTAAYRFAEYTPAALKATLAFAIEDIRAHRTERNRAARQAAETHLHPQTVGARLEALLSQYLTPKTQNT
ncbi:MAG: glycosyltransferase family 4 protein [Pseudanabaenaceae cyanobacterium]